MPSTKDAAGDLYGPDSVQGGVDSKMVKNAPSVNIWTWLPKEFGLSFTNVQKTINN